MLALSLGSARELKGEIKKFLERDFVPRPIQMFVRIVLVLYWFMAIPACIYIWLCWAVFFYRVTMFLGGSELTALIISILVLVIGVVPKDKS